MRTRLLFLILKQTAARPWKLLRWLTLCGWLFICWHLMYDSFVRATVERNYGPFHCDESPRPRPPLPLPLHPSRCSLVLQGGHPSENIDCWTVSICVCIRKVELRREIANAFFCARLCVHSGSLCTNGEIGGESTPEGRGSCKEKRKKTKN